MTNAVSQGANALNKSPSLLLKPSHHWLVDPRTGEPWPDECSSSVDNPFCYEPRPDADWSVLEAFGECRNLRELHSWRSGELWCEPRIPLNVTVAWAGLAIDDAFRKARFNRSNIGVCLSGGDIVVEITGTNKAEHDDNLGRFLQAFSCSLDSYIVAQGWWGHTFIYMLDRMGRCRIIGSQLDLPGVTVHGSGSCVPIPGSVDAEGRSFALRHGGPSTFWRAAAAPQSLAEVILIQAPFTARGDQASAIVRGMSEEWFVAPIEGELFYWQITYEDHAPNPSARRVAKITPHKRAAFRERHENQLITIDRKQISVADLYLTHPERLEYTGVVCDPEYELHQQGYFNTWRGYGVRPASGDCSAILTFLRDVVCGSYEEQFAYLLNYLAWKVQNPGRPPEVAIILKALKGAGKNTFAEDILGAMFGRSAYYTQRPKDVFGDFNASLMTALVAILDEAAWAGNPAHEAQLKAMITSRELRAEEKHMRSSSFKNRIAFVMLANAEWVAPASEDERRYFVPDMSSKYSPYAPGADRAACETYWSETRSNIKAQLPAFLDYLLSVETPQHPRENVPQTNELQAQKVQSLKGVASVLHDALLEGRFPGQGRADPPPHAPISALGEEVDWATAPLVFRPGAAKQAVREAIIDALPSGQRWHKEPSMKSIITDLRRLIGAKISDHDEGGNTWIIPPLPECIANFERATGISIS